MEDDQVQNRMGDPLDLVELRETAEKPSLLTRWVWSALGAARTRTGMTVILALLILLALAVGYWVTS